AVVAPAQGGGGIRREIAARHAQGSVQRRDRGPRSRLVHDRYGSARRGEGRLQRAGREPWQARGCGDGRGKSIALSRKKFRGRVKRVGRLEVNNEYGRRAAGIGWRHWEGT